MDYNVTYRKKDKGWQCIISYKLGDAWKQKAKQGFKTQKEAKPWIDDTIEELKKITANYTGGYTLEMLYEQYKKDFKESRAAFTMDNLEVAYVRFKALKDMSLEDITKEAIQDCVNGMSNLEKNTIKVYLIRIKRLFNAAINKYKLIKENPVYDIVIPEKEIPRRSRLALTQGELEEVINKIDKLKLKVFISLAGKAGLRCSEIIGLTKSDIGEKYIEVNKQWKKFRDGSYGFGMLKNKEKGKRKIPIAPDLKKLLDEYIPKCKTDRLFPYSTPTSASTAISDNLYRRDIDVTLHEFRHTFATTLLANGLDVKTVAYLMGDTVSTVTSTYLHFTSDMMENAEEVIGKIFLN